MTALPPPLWRGEMHVCELPERGSYWVCSRCGTHWIYRRATYDLWRWQQASYSQPRANAVVLVLHRRRRRRRLVIA